MRAVVGFVFNLVNMIFQFHLKWKLFFFLIKNMPHH